MAKSITENSELGALESLDANKPFLKESQLTVDTILGVLHQQSDLPRIGRVGEAWVDGQSNRLWVWDKQRNWWANCAIGQVSLSGVFCRVLTAAELEKIPGLAEIASKDEIPNRNRLDDSQKTFVLNVRMHGIPKRLTVNPSLSPEDTNDFSGTEGEKIVEGYQRIDAPPVESFWLPFGLGVMTDLSGEGLTSKEFLVRHEASHGTLDSQQRPTESETSKLFGEILEVGNQSAICWLDVAPGSRVKVEVPVEKLTGISLAPGRRFAIHDDPANQECQFKPLQRDSSLDARFEEMSGRFREWHASGSLPRDFPDE